MMQNSEVYIDVLRWLKISLLSQSIPAAGNISLWCHVSYIWPALHRNKSNAEPNTYTHTHVHMRGTFLIAHSVYRIYSAVKKYRSWASNATSKKSALSGFELYSQVRLRNAATEKEKHSGAELSMCDCFCVLKKKKKIQTLNRLGVGIWKWNCICTSTPARILTC